jgi:hypothetical protein
MAAIPTTTLAGPGDEKDAVRSPGYVDGSALTKLAAPDGELVEITLHRSMLRVLRKAFSKTDRAMAAFLDPIQSIDAIVATIAESDLKRAEDEIHRMTQRLESEGWERWGRVRQSEGKITVLAHTDGDQIDGLVVFVFQQSGNDTQLVFTNIAGPMDLGMLRLEGNSCLVPGFDVGIEAIEQERAAREEQADDEAAQHSERQDVNQHSDRNAKTNREAGR